LALQKKPLLITAIPLIAFTVFLCYEYTWGVLAPRTGPSAPDFEISASPKTVFLHSWEGSSNKTVITVKSVNSFSSKVTVKIGYSYLIGDVRLFLNSSEVTPPASGQAYCLLTLYTITPIHPGQYYVDIVGKAGNIEHSVRITIVVTY